jgi:hypothetical protein
MMTISAVKTRRGFMGAVLSCVPLLAGCMTLQRMQGHPAGSLPADHLLMLGQLVVHSDFPLPEDHRLLLELQSLRGDVLSVLALPESREPIQVYLFETTEDLQRFARARYPNFPDRRAFFMESDTRLAVYAFWGDRVAEDLRHEVAHGYLHASVPRVPLWLDEGLAEYFEVSRGEHGLNRRHVEELRAALAVGQWKPDLARLKNLGDGSTMTQLDYAESWLWAHWLIHGTPEGKATLQTYLRSLRGQPEQELDLAAALGQQFPNPAVEVLRHLDRLPAK